MNKRPVGRPPLENPRSERVTIALTKRERDALNHAAGRHGTRPSVLAGEIVTRYLHPLLSESDSA